MIVQQTIETKLTDAFAPTHLEVINESGNHSVPAGSETHFKVVMVWDGFEGKSKVMRHRSVNKVLKAELDGPVHALSLQLFTPSQWQENGGTFQASPLCASKKF
jgi:BolA protein